ncbi:hypothetical protein GGR55DRAFT_696120 [Xylaria sp. FL0064]|nr:hypothetical protein GGR55DRAFT_696120 [Xylaria sp. FL0064]
MTPRKTNLVILQLVDLDNHGWPSSQLPADSRLAAQRTSETVAVRILIAPLGSLVAVQVVAMKTRAFAATPRPQAAVSKGLSVHLMAASAILESVTITTTFTSVIYHTSTIVDTAMTTNMGVTTEFVTVTVTRDNIDVATITNYVTSTKIAKRTLPENPKRTEHPVEKKHRPTPPTPSPAPIPTMARGLGALRDSLEGIGLLPKRDVTSYIYDYIFVWDTITSDIFETSTVASEMSSMSTQFSAITSTKETSTEQVTTKTLDPIVVMTTFLVGVTNSGDSEAATVTTFIDGGGASGLDVATGISTTTSRSDNNSPSGPNIVVPTSSNPEASVSSKESDLSTGAKAGIGAGAGGAGLALLGALVFFALGKRRRPTSIIAGDNNQAPAVPIAVSNWTPPPRV